MSNDKSIELPTIKNRDENGEVDMEVLNETIEYIRPAVPADGGDISQAIRKTEFLLSRSKRL